MTKRKQARETRTKYQVRKKSRASPPRPQPSETPVPWEQRIAPTDEQVKEWNAWLNDHAAEFEKTYPGHYLAIWDKRVIAASADGDELYRLAHLVEPRAIPIVTYIPRAEDFPFVLTPFPASFSKK